MTELEDNRVERYIWRHIGKKSAREMAEELGVSPDEILRAKRDLVDSVDELTLQVQRSKLLVTLQELADDAQTRSLRASDEFFAGTVNASVGAIKTLLVELNRRSKEDSSAVNELNQNRIRELVALVQETVDESVSEIAEAHGIDPEELFTVFNANLGRAAARRDADNV